jgi:hypothetical protein
MGIIRSLRELMIPCGGTCKAFMNPSGIHLFSFQSLMKASFQRDFGKINDPATGGVHEGLAERGGFEPPVRRKANNGFRDRRIRPLCHLSSIFKPLPIAIGSPRRLSRDAGPFPRFAESPLRSDLQSITLLFSRSR